MDDSEVELAQEQNDSAVEASKGQVEKTAEELVAKAIAPVKREFLRPLPLRPCSNNHNNAVSEAKAEPPQSAVVKEKKSKRQLKRERREQKKSVSNICPVVANTGDVSSCPYNNKCRFSHDVEAYKDQKPDDLEGECPFVSAEEPCPYGLTCRFLGTHREGVSVGSINACRNSSEINVFSKDIQKLLWKNKMKFPKADAKLKALGLLGQASEWALLR